MTAEKADGILSARSLAPLATRGRRSFSGFVQEQIGRKAANMNPHGQETPINNTQERYKHVLRNLLAEWA